MIVHAMQITLFLFKLYQPTHEQHMHTHLRIAHVGTCFTVSVNSFLVELCNSFSALVAVQEPAQPRPASKYLCRFAGKQSEQIQPFLCQNLICLDHRIEKQFVQKRTLSGTLFITTIVIISSPSISVTAGENCVSIGTQSLRGFAFIFFHGARPIFAVLI